MANIKTDACPNFTGSAHDNSRLSFVPQQLHGAHLHPLKALGSMKQVKNADGVYEDAINKETGEPTLDEKTPGRGKYPLNWSAHEDGLKSSDKRYGVCLTRSRLFVLDIDTHNGVDGNKTLAAVCAELGLDGLETFTVATGTGGFHYYFQLPEALGEQEIKKSVNLWPGVDVFPQNQQVVGPGTKRTLEDGSICRYEVSNDAEIAQMPDVLVQAIIERIEENDADKKKARASAPVAGGYSPKRVGDGLSDKQHEVLSSMCGELSGAQAGERHATILRVAFKAGSFFGPEHETNVFPEIQAAAFASGHDETCGCVEDAFQSGMQQWQPFVPETRPAPRRKQVEQEPISLPPVNARLFTNLAMGRFFGESTEKDLLAVREWRKWAGYSEHEGCWSEREKEEINATFGDWYSDVVHPEIVAQIEEDYAQPEEETEDEMKERERAKKILIAKALDFLNETKWKSTTSYVYGKRMQSSEIFDANPNVILSPSGAVELRSGALRKAKPEDYFTKRTTVEYVPGAKSELWDQVLSAFHPDALPYLKVIVGQALTGYQPSDASIFFFSAGGSNGKSMFLDVIATLMGDYADAPDSELLKAGAADSFARIVFKGLRMALLEETAEGQWLDDKIVKKLTGTDKMRGSKKFQDEETFKVVTTVFITTNELPQVSANDEGTWRRLKLFPMPYTFVAVDKYDKETSPANHRPRDPRLKRAKENTEILQAALAWAVEGAVEWYANDMEELPAPAVMENAQAAWRAKQDKIGSWWHEMIVPDSECFILVSDLYETYKLSMRDSGREAESKQKFMGSLENHALFQEAGAEYAQRQRVPRANGALSLTHSTVEQPKQSGFGTLEREYLSTLRDAEKARFWVKGLRFRKASDDAENN